MFAENLSKMTSLLTKVKGSRQTFSENQPVDHVTPFWQTKFEFFKHEIHQNIICSAKGASDSQPSNSLAPLDIEIYIHVNCFGAVMHHHGRRLGILGLHQTV